MSSPFIQQWVFITQMPGPLLTRDGGISRIPVTFICHASGAPMTFHTGTSTGSTFLFCYGARAVNLTTKPQHNQVCKKFLPKP